MADNNIEETIRELVRKAGVDFSEDAPMSFWTRDHGDMVDDAPGIEDINAARALCKAIREACPTVKVTADTCDEWVCVEVQV